MPDNIFDQVKALGMPIEQSDCIGDTREVINNTIEYLALQADLTNETLALTADSAQRQLNRHETRINELSAPLRGDIISAPWSTQNRFLSTVYNNVVPSNKGGAGSQFGLLSANGAGVVVGLENTPFGYNNQASDPKPAAIVTYGYMDQLLSSDYAPLTALNKEIVDRYNEDINLTNTKIQIPVGNHWPNSIPTAGFILTYDPTSNKTDKWVPRTPANPPLVGDIVSTNFITTYNNVVPANKGGAGSVNGILSANGSGFVSAAVPSIDYVIPTDLSPYAKTLSLSSYLTVPVAQATYTPLVDTENVKRSWIKNPLIDSETELLYTQSEINNLGATYGVPGQGSDALNQDNVLTLNKFTSGSAPYYSFDLFIKENGVLPAGFTGLSGWNWISKSPKAPTLTGAISAAGGYGVDAYTTSYIQVVPSNKGGAGTQTGILSANGAGVVIGIQPKDNINVSIVNFAVEPGTRNNSLIKYDDYQKKWRVASPEDEPFAEVNFITGLAKQEAGWYSGCAFSERRVITWGQLDGKGINDHYKFSRTNRFNRVSIPHNYTYIPFHSEYESNGNIGNNIHYFDLRQNRTAYIKEVVWNWSCGMAWVRDENKGKFATGLTASLSDYVNGPIGADDSVWVIGNHFTYVPKKTTVLPVPVSTPLTPLTPGFAATITEDNGYYRKLDEVYLTNSNNRGNPVLNYVWERFSYQLGNRSNVSWSEPNKRTNIINAASHFSSVYQHQYFTNVFAFTNLYSYVAATQQGNYFNPIQQFGYRRDRTFYFIPKTNAYFNPTNTLAQRNYHEASFLVFSGGVNGTPTTANNGKASLQAAWTSILHQGKFSQVSFEIKNSDQITALKQLSSGAMFQINSTTLMERPGQSNDLPEVYYSKTPEAGSRKYGGNRPDSLARRKNVSALLSQYDKTRQLKKGLYQIISFGVTKSQESYAPYHVPDTTPFGNEYLDANNASPFWLLSRMSTSLNQSNAGVMEYTIRDHPYGKNDGLTTYSLDHIDLAIGDRITFNFFDPYTPHNAERTWITKNASAIRATLGYNVGYYNGDDEEAVSNRFMQNLYRSVKAPYWQEGTVSLSFGDFLNNNNNIKTGVWQTYTATSDQQRWSQIKVTSNVPHNLNQGDTFYVYSQETTLDHLDTFFDTTDTILTDEYFANFEPISYSFVNTVELDVSSNAYQIYKDIAGIKSTPMGGIKTVGKVTVASVLNEYAFTYRTSEIVGANQLNLFDKTFISNNVLFKNLNITPSKSTASDVPYHGVILFGTRIANLDTQNYTPTEEEKQSIYYQTEKDNKENGYAPSQHAFQYYEDEQYITNFTGSIGIPGNGGGINKQTNGFVKVNLPGFPRTQLVNINGHPLNGKIIKEEIIKIQCKSDPGVPADFDKYAKELLDDTKIATRLADDDPLKYRARLFVDAQNGNALSGRNDFSNYTLWGALTNFGNLYVWGRSKDGCFGLGKKFDKLTDTQINEPTILSIVEIANELPPFPAAEVALRNFRGAIADFEFTSAEFDSTCLGVITVSGYDSNWPNLFPTRSTRQDTSTYTFPHRGLFFAGDNKNYQLGGGLKDPIRGTNWPTSMDTFMRAQKLSEKPGCNQYGLCTPSQLQANAQLQPEFINNAKRIVRSLYGGRQANGYIDTDGRLWMCGSNANGLLGNCGYLAKINPESTTPGRSTPEIGHYCYGAGVAYKSVLVSDITRESATDAYNSIVTNNKVYDRIPQYVQEYPFRTSPYSGATIKTALAPDYNNKDQWTQSLKNASSSLSLAGPQYKGRGYFCEAKIHTWQDEAEVGYGSGNIAFNRADAVAVYNQKDNAPNRFGIKELIDVPVNEKIKSDQFYSNQAGNIATSYTDTEYLSGGNGAFTVKKQFYRPRPKFVDAYIAGMNAPYLVAMAEIDSAAPKEFRRQYNLYACGQNGVVTFPGTPNEKTGLAGTFKFPNDNAAAKDSLAKANHGYLGIDSEGLTINRLMPCVFLKEYFKDDEDPFLADPDQDDLATMYKDYVSNAKKIYCSDTNGSRTVSYTSNTVTNTTYSQIYVPDGHCPRRGTWVDTSITNVNIHNYINATYANLGASGYIDDRDLAYIAGYNTFNDPPDYNSISYQYYTRLPINNVDDMVLGGDLEAHKYQFFRTKSGTVWGQGQGTSNVLGLENDCYMPIRII